MEQPVVVNTIPSNSIFDNAASSQQQQNNFPKTVSPQKRSRKHVHEKILVNDDIEFEIISLDEDDNDNDASVNSKERPTHNKSRTKTTKGSITKVTHKKTAEPESDNIKSENVATIDLTATDAEPANAAKVKQKYLNEITEFISQLAEERMRINFLLRRNGMREVNFDYPTTPEVIEKEINDRMDEYIAKNT